MNTIYRIVWNVTLGKWVVASELAKGRKKAAKRSVVLATFAIGMGIAFNAAAFDPIGAGAKQGNAGNMVIGDNADGSAAGCTTSYLTTAACSTLIGNNTSSTGAASTVVGNYASVTGTHGVAMGAYATAASYSQAFGTGAKATGQWSTAIGQGSQATQSNAVAVGTNSGAIGDASVAIGGDAHANADQSFAIGWKTNASGVGSMAFGHQVKALSDYAIALGAGSTVNSNSAGSVAMGYKATVAAYVNDAVALGSNSVADRANTVSVGSNDAGGQRQVVNVAKGTLATDAVNVSQLGDATRYFKANGKNDGTDDASAQGANAIAIGSNAKAVKTFAEGAIAIGNNAMAESGGGANPQGSVAMGVSSRAYNAGSVAIGYDARAGVDAAGDKAASAHYGVSIGYQSRSANGSTAVGYLAGANGNSSSAFGIRATVDAAATSGLAMGNGARVTAAGAAGIALGSGSVADRGNAMSVGSTSVKRQVINLAAGTADTDAVNFSQLKGTAGTVAAALGGGVTLNADGTITKPSYSVQGGTHDNVGDALGAVDSSLTSIDGRVTKNEGDIVNIDGRVTTNEGDIVDIRNKLGSGSIGLVQQDEATRDITVAASSDGARVDFTGTDGARKLVGVAKGDLSDTSTEAVNGSQLFATNVRVTKNEGDIVNLDGRVTKNEGDIIDLGDRINNGSVGLVQQASTTAVVTVAAATGGTVVDFTGIDGTRQLKGVSEGSDGTEAVNVTQLRNEIANASAGDTRYFKADGANDGSDDAINTGSRSVAIGAGSQATADNAVALGAGSVADRADAVSVGSKGKERQIINVAEGKEDTDAVNVAQLKKAGLVGGDGSTFDAVVYDAGSNRGSVTFGGLGGTKLTNVMAGLVSATSTDAVNGSQLWILQDQVNNLGDRVTNIENNGVPGTGPVTPQPELGAGEGGRDPAFAANGDGGPASATGKDSVAAGTGASATADNSVAIGAGSVADRADTVSVGSAGAERQISNVAAGTQRTDAANWGQVQDALATANRYTDDRFDGVNRRIGEVQRQANRGIAASAALINVTPYMPGKTVLNAGVANYRGESALGVGVSRWNDTGRVNFNAGVSAAAGDSPIFRMGVGVVLGD